MNRRLAILSLPAARFDAIRTRLPIVALAFSLHVASKLDPATGLAADWPGWRGPRHDGISLETNAPVHWDRKENTRWRSPLPGPGNSSPIVWKDTVFITQSVRDRRALVAFDRRTGKTRWNGVVASTTPPRTSRYNPPCAASPATDGERIVAWFGSDGVHAFDFAGTLLWSQDLGPVRHQWGYASSPVLHEDRVFLNFGPGEEEYVVALDSKTGRELWRTRGPARPADDSYGTWSTPLVVNVDGADQIIVALRDYFAALRPADGTEIWRCGGMGPQAKTSPCAGAGIVVMSGDLRGGEIAVRLGGQGDVTETRRLWRESPARSRISTGIILGDHLYNARANGLIDCISLATGDTLWAERAPGAGANSPIWASPILVGSRLYFVNQGGDTVIVDASPKFRWIATNPIAEVCNASPALAYGDLFLRTWDALWCIRSNQESPADSSGTSPDPAAKRAPSTSNPAAGTAPKSSPPSTP